MQTLPIRVPVAKLQPLFLSWFVFTLAACHAASSEQAAGASQQATKPPVQVNQVEVQMSTIPLTIALTGTLRGQQETDLAANATGRITELYVERGSQVQVGSPLVRLDMRANELAQHEAEANARLATAQANNAEQDCRRYEELQRKGAISAREYERAVNQCEITKAQVAAATARSALADQTLGDSLIRAPFSGVISERYVNVGQFVRSDSRVVSLVTLDPLRLEFTVAEQDWGMLSVGQTLKFTVPAHRDEIFVATIKYIGAAIRRDTRDVVAEALVSNTDKRLRPGMFASLQLPVASKEMIAVPKQAIVQRGDANYLFVVQNGRLHERVVQIAGTSEQLVGIPSGLSAGEKVVSPASATLRNGERVQ